MPSTRTWTDKFRDAFRGLRSGVRGQRSFRVHLPAAAAVIASGAILRVSLLEWCVLLLSITIVLATELFNSALESMAKAFGDQPNPHLAQALDIAASAVLIASIGASLVGGLLFIVRLGILLQG
jgi:diacylglycerol kinase